MKEIAVITEEGVLPAGSPLPTTGNYDKKRVAVRVIIFDNDGRVAMNHYTQKMGYDEEWYIPGGGVEEGESVQDALYREIGEEVGCAVRDVKELGLIRRYFPIEGLESLDHWFYGSISGDKCSPKLIERDIKQGLESIWVYPDDVLSKLDLKNVYGEESRKNDRRTLVMRHNTYFLLNLAKKIKI